MRDVDRSNPAGILRVRLIISAENTSWIIGKMGERLVQELTRAGVAATMGSDPDDSADINHWMSYGMVSRRAGRKSTVCITHIDDPYKTAHLASILGVSVDLGLCMSRDMRRALVQWGIPADRLWYVLPAHDVPAAPTRIRIAIATRLYPDGRKREALLLRLAGELDLAPFHFEIGGGGWDAVVPRLREAGATVAWDPGTADYQADYRALITAMSTCEYYLYLGMDEGSLGTLDALALGLKTIATPQGFHLDAPAGLTEPVETYEQLLEVFSRLAAQRQERLASVRDWTWEQNALDHLLVWNALLEGSVE
ncbi:MAG: hypothetical protein ABIT01_09315, partial [Thermoanaerobaculia bacterium]